MKKKKFDKFMTRKVRSLMYYTCYGWVNNELTVLEEFTCKERPKELDYCRKYNVPKVVLRRTKSIYDYYRMYDKDVVKYGEKIKTETVLEDVIEDE